MSDSPLVHFADWGHMDYGQAWERQKAFLEETVQQKVANRSLPSAERKPPLNHLFFCEHPPVFTLGKSGDPNNLLLPPEELKEKGFSYYPIERGGDITYHGPGQLTGYPIWDLDQFGSDLHRYIRGLEEAVIRTLADYGLQGERLEGYTGVWLEVEGPRVRKICAIGVKCRRWVSMHGFAFNINTDLSHFDYIIPCGIRDKAVSSLAAELGQPVALAEVAQHLRHHLADVFGFILASEEAAAKE